MPPTPPKSFTLLGFKRFWGSGVGKKDAKIPRCVSEVILDTFGRFLTNFLVLAECKNTIIYNVFVPFGLKKVHLATC